VSVGTQRYWAAWFISCPESSEVLTPIAGLRSSGAKSVRDPLRSFGTAMSNVVTKL